jgi:hypothetical protein
MGLSCGSLALLFLGAEPPGHHVVVTSDSKTTPF